MASIFSPFLSQFSPPHRSLSPFPHNTKHRIRLLKVSSHSSPKPQKALPFLCNHRSFGLQEAPKGAKQEQEPIPEAPISSKVPKGLVNSAGFCSKPTKTIIQSVVRPVVYTLFCVAIGFCPIGVFQVRAIAAPVAGEVNVGRKKEQKLSSKGHEYADYTGRLLEEVSGLLRCIEEVRRGNGDVEEVKSALKAVKARKEELQGGIMDGLYKELRVLRKEKEELKKQAGSMVDDAVKTRTELDKSVQKAEKENVEKLEVALERMDGEYGEIWERVAEIEDRILRRETAALSIGVRELCFIERECEQLVERFSREMRLKNTDR